MVALMMQYRIAAILLFLVQLVVNDGYAQSLVDPTRPLDGKNSYPAAIENGVAQDLVLRAVLISATKKTAMINDQTYGLYDKVGDYVLLAISESEVSLQKGKQVRVLKLYPGLDKGYSQSSAKSPSRTSELKER